MYLVLQQPTFHVGIRPRRNDRAMAAGTVRAPHPPIKPAIGLRLTGAGPMADPSRAMAVALTPDLLLATIAARFHGRCPHTEAAGMDRQLRHTARRELNHQEDRTVEDTPTEDLDLVVEDAPTADLVEALPEAVGAGETRAGAERSLLAYRRRSFNGFRHQRGPGRAYPLLLERGVAGRPGQAETARGPLPRRRPP